MCRHKWKALSGSGLGTRLAVRVIVGGHFHPVSNTKLWEAGEDRDLSLLLPSCCQALECVGTTLETNIQFLTISQKSANWLTSNMWYSLFIFFLIEMRISTEILSNCQCFHYSAIILLEIQLNFKLNKIVLHIFSVVQMMYPKATHVFRPFIRPVFDCLQYALTSLTLLNLPGSPPLFLNLSDQKLKNWTARRPENKARLWHCSGNTAVWWHFSYSIKLDHLSPSGKRGWERWNW